MVLKKIVDSFFVAIINLFFCLFILALAIGVNQTIKNYNTLSLINFFLSLSIFLSIILLLLNIIIASIKFDGLFRNKIIELASKDVFLTILPISANFLLKMKLFRGAVYLGCVYFCCVPLKPLLETQKYLVNVPEFKNRITFFMKLFLYIMLFLFLMTLIIALVSWFKSLI